MSDNLKWVGKYIGDTGRMADEALARVAQHRPTVETVRDVFDNVVPFAMVFNTSKEFPTTILTLEFFGPPPNIGCCADCFCTVCQLIQNHTSTTVSLYRAYLSGSVTVYINNIKTTAFTESSSTTITLTTLPNIADILKICYIYRYDGCTT